MHAHMLRLKARIQLGSLDADGSERGFKRAPSQLASTVKVSTMTGEVSFVCKTQDQYPPADWCIEHRRITARSDIVMKLCAVAVWESRNDGRCQN